MKSSKLFIATLMAGHLALLAGCSDDDAAQKTTANAPATTTTANDPHAGMKIRLAANQGRVLQSQTASGYTYAEVEQNGSTFWIAGADTEMNPGDIVAWGAKKLMRDFYSKAIDQTFDDIYFVSSLEVNHASTRLQARGPAVAGLAAQQGDNGGRVVSSENAGGYTYLEVDRNGTNVWLAVTQTGDIAAGEYVSWSNAAAMHNFTSKALNRTFDTIYFAGAVRKVSPEALQANLSQGTVLSTEASGGYSYMEVDTGNGKVWVAAPAADVSVGDTISWSGAATMRNFNSPSLGRTFDEILFAGGVNRLN
ncbi:GW dipeptide domain-containing protein [Motiliproteus sediminis]|uniref:GW dipeptide domain-containing protein n=1 Tax=Motiliproteus sediminis TaxID=1468178 RepID=UPI001AEFFFA1|nr:GW dipeptide domain-containing protein [Motiliproteus sediminis]